MLALAERAGFEPAEVLPSHDFQSCALGRTMLPLLDLCSSGHYTIVAGVRQIYALAKAQVGRGWGNLLPSRLANVKICAISGEMRAWDLQLGAE